MARSLDMDKARAKRKEHEKRAEGEFHDHKQGWNYYYVLPPWSDANEIWKDVHQHGFGLVCPAAMSGGKKKCLMCDELKRQARRGSGVLESDPDRRLQTRGLLNAVRKEHIKNADPADARLLGLTPKLFEQFVEWIDENDTDPSNPRKAYIIGIHRKGKGIRTRYRDLQVAQKPINISKYITDDYLEEAIRDLDTVRAARPSSDKDMRKAIREALGGASDDDLEADESLDDDDFGGDDSDDPEADDFADDDDEDPDVDDDDGGFGDLDDDEDEGEGDEEEEVAPPKRSRRSKSSRRRTPKKKARRRSR